MDAITPDMFDLFNIFTKYSRKLDYQKNLEFKLHLHCLKFYDEITVANISIHAYSDKHTFDRWQLTGH